MDGGLRWYGQTAFQLSEVHSFNINNTCSYVPGSHETSLSFRRLLPDFCHLPAFVEILQVAVFLLNRNLVYWRHFIVIHQVHPLVSKILRQLYLKAPAHETRSVEPNQQGKWVRVGARPLKEYTRDVRSTESVINLQLRDFLLSSIIKESNCDSLVTG